MVRGASRLAFRLGGMTRSFALLASILLTTVACGRSSLPLGLAPIDDDGSGGNGAMGGAGGMGGAPTGGGGEGGLPPDCSVLQIEGPVGVAGGVMAHQRQPSLVQLEAGPVVVAMEWTDASFPNAPKEVRHTSLQPWSSSFPATDVAPSFLADFDKGVSFEATTALGDGFALLMSGEGGLSGGVAFNPFFFPGEGGIGPSFDLGPPAQIDFVSHDGQGRYLLGITNTFGPGISVLNAAIVSLGPGGGLVLEGGPLPIACSQGAPVRGAAAFRDGEWIIASSTGALNGPGDCAPGPPPPGPPQRMQAALIDPTGLFVVYDTVELEFPIDQVDLVATPTGHVAFWSGATDGFGGPLFAWPLDPTGNPTNLPQFLEGNDQAVIAGSWDAGSFGDGFLLQWRSGVDQAIHVRRHAATLEPLGQAVVDAVNGAVGRPDVIGDPSGDDRALVAQPVLGTEGDQMRLFRVGCP